MTGRELPTETKFLRRLLHGDAIYQQSLRYVAVGACVFSLDLGAFTALLLTFGQPSYLVVNLAAKILSALAGFFLHKHFTFTWEQRYHMARQMLIYAALLLFNVVMSSALIYVLVGLVSLPTIPSRVTIDIVVIVTSFVVSRNFVFKMRSLVARTGLNR